MSDRIYDTLAGQAESLGIFGHGYTYSAHPVCAAVASGATTDAGTRCRRPCPNPRPLFAERVARMNRFDFVGNTRAIGLIGAMEFSSDPQTKAKFDPGEENRGTGRGQDPGTWGDPAGATG